MNVDERDGRIGATGREGVRRAPRSGGRTAVPGTTPRRSERPRVERADRRAAAYPVEGSTALRIEEPVVAEAAPRLKVAPPPPVAVPRAPFVALVLVVVVAGVLGILMVNTKTNENAFRLDTLQNQQALLDREQQRLEKQVAENEAPGNLAAQARKLGLVEPGPPAFIRLPDGKIIGVPRPANGQPAITSQGTGR